jgi:hypothetical protein
MLIPDTQTPTLSDPQQNQTNLGVVKGILIQRNTAERSGLNNSINKLRSEVLSGMAGMMNTSRFLVTITAPKAFGEDTTAQTDSEKAETIGTNAQAGFSRTQLPFLCNAVNIPGLTIDTVDNLPYGYGYKSRMPVGQTFPEVTCTFYGDSQLLSKNFFTKWMQSIVNFNGDAAMNGTTKVNNAAPFEIYYKDSYQTTIEITMFDVKSEGIVTYKLHNAFPVTIGDVAVAWENSDQLYTFTVSFSYDFWTSTFTKENTIDTEQERNINNLANSLTIGAGVDGRNYQPNFGGVAEVDGRNYQPNYPGVYSSGSISNIVDTLSVNTLLNILNSLGRIR